MHQELYVWFLKHRSVFEIVTVLYSATFYYWIRPQNGIAEV